MWILFLDIETNGLDPEEHYPIEICILAVNSEMNARAFVLESLVDWGKEKWMAGDGESIEFTGISWDLICREGNNPDTIMNHIVNALEDHGINSSNGFFLCQNPSFDRVFFNKIVPPNIQKSRDFPYHWLDLASMYWGKVGTCCPDDILSLSKDSIANYLGIDAEIQPHRASGGVKHLFDCYRALLFLNEE